MTRRISRVRRSWVSAAFFLFPFSFFLPHLRADAGWMLTTADFKQRPVGLDALNDQGVHLTPADGGAKEMVPFESFLQLDRAAGVARRGQGKFTLLLAGGDRMVGEPVGLKDEQLVWRSPSLGEVKVGLKSVRALLRAGQVLENPDDAVEEDTVLLANGDSAKGIVTDITDGKLMIQAGNPLEIPLESIRHIHFAMAGMPKARPERAFRLQLTDSSIFTAVSVESDGQKAKLKLADGSARELPLAAVVSIEQLNGPVSWLSSRTAEKVVQTPYLAGKPWSTRMDSTVGGKPIQFGGRTYGRGIGVHAFSRIEYKLDGAYEAFRTQYAIAQDAKRQYADVTVRILLDGKPVHEQAHVKADVLSPVVMVDLSKEAKVLTLEVDYGDANDTQDRFNWIEPALLRHKPVAPTTQP